MMARIQTGIYRISIQDPFLEKQEESLMGKRWNTFVKTIVAYKLTVLHSKKGWSLIFIKD